MPSFIYNGGIPNPPNNPSADVPLMKVNTDSINGIIGSDHFSFQTQGNLDGYHKQVHLVNEAAPGIDTASAVLYANLINGQSWPIWQNALGSTVMMSSPTTRLQRGFTSLPGSMLLQWGFDPVNAGAGSINFVTPFATVVGFAPIVTIATFRTTTPTNVDTVYIQATSAGAFSYFNTSTGAPATGLNNIFWIAVGPI